jgi:hypothetical protein
MKFGIHDGTEDRAQFNAIKGACAVYLMDANDAHRKYLPISTVNGSGIAIVV